MATKNFFKNPTHLLIDGFKATYKTALDQVRSFLELGGFMGYIFLDEMGDLPPTIANFIAKIRGGNPLDVLDAAFRIDEAEMGLLTRAQARLMAKLPGQMVARENNGFEACQFLTYADWSNPTGEDLKGLSLLFDPLDTGRDLEPIKRSLEVIPPETRIIGYATKAQYGSFLRAVQTAKPARIQEAFKVIKPISFS